MRRRDFMKSAAVLAAGAVPLSRAAEAGETARSTLPKRPLGATGEKVSVLALGGVIGMLLPPKPDHEGGAGGFGPRSDPILRRRAGRTRGEDDLPAAPRIPVAS